MHCPRSQGPRQLRPRASSSFSSLRFPPP